MTIDVTALTRLIGESKMPDEFKKRLIPIAQVASEEDRKRIFEKVKNFDLRFLKITQGKIKLKPEDLIVVTGKRATDF